MRAGREHPLIASDDDSVLECVAVVGRPRDDGFADIAFEYFSPGHIHHPVRTADDRRAAADTGAFIDLHIFRHRLAAIQRSGHVGPWIFLPVTPIDPRKVQPAIRVSMQRVEGMLNDAGSSFTRTDG